LQQGLAREVASLTSGRNHMGYGGAADGVAILIGFGLAAAPAQASYVVSLVQEGANVVATGSGSIDLVAVTPTCRTLC
jgi:hypothetical protein